MGMYDYVFFSCPECRSRIDHQSTAGERTLEGFVSNSVPEAIADDIEGEEVWCSQCSKTWMIVKAPQGIKRVRMGLIERID